MNSAKEAAAFLRKRALIEQDYAAQLMKLGSSHSSVKEKGKAQSYDTQWTEFEKMHYKLGEARMQFSTSIVEMADNIQVLFKNTERSRKQLKESCNRQLKELQDAESFMEKARLKFEHSSEDWERSQGLDIPIGKKNSKPTNMKKSQSLTKGLNNLKQRFQNDFKLGLPKTEEEARQKASSANETYKQALFQANHMRQQYFNNHLPRFVRALKETNADCDEGLSKYLIKYAKCIESLVMVEATMVSPLEESEPGLLQIIEKIDNHADFNEFLTSHLGKERLNKQDHEYISYNVLMID
jgi:hypothetical protein